MIEFLRDTREGRIYKVREEGLEAIAWNFITLFNGRFLSGDEAYEESLKGNWLVII